MVEQRNALLDLCVSVSFHGHIECYNGVILVIRSGVVLFFTVFCSINAMLMVLDMYDELIE